MLVSKNQTIEDQIIESLTHYGNLDGPKLLEHIKAKRGPTSKQAMYVSLNKLLNEEIVAKIGNTYYISKLWIDKISHLFNLNQSYKNDIVFSLTEGESITYKFSSLLSCDTHWAHIFNILTEWLPENIPIFVWNPHEWFVIGRSKVEDEIFQLFHKHNKKAFYSIAGNTPLDKKFKRDFGDEHLSININNPLPFNNNYYVNIFDDYIIEIFIDKRLAEKIEEFYQKNKDLNDKNIIAFEDLISEKYNIRMKISKNNKKAHKLRKQLAKDFYISKKYTV